MTASIGCSMSRGLRRADTAVHRGRSRVAGRARWLLTPSAWKREPMPPGAIRRDTPLSISRGLRRIGRHQPGGALDDAEPAEELALRHRPVAGEPMAARRGGERREIHLCGEVGLAGRAQRIVVAVAAYRLQRIAEPRLRVTVVDEQCSDRRTERGKLRRPVREAPARAVSKMSPSLRRCDARGSGDGAARRCRRRRTPAAPPASSPTPRSRQRPSRNTHCATAACRGTRWR